METSFENQSEVNKESIDQRRVMAVQLKVMKLFGLDSDEKVMEYIGKYEAPFRNIVNNDPEVKNLLLRKDVNDQMIADILKEKLLQLSDLN